MPLYIPFNTTTCEQQPVFLMGDQDETLGDVEISLNVILSQIPILCWFALLCAHLYSSHTHTLPAVHVDVSAVCLLIAPSPVSLILWHTVKLQAAGNITRILTVIGRTRRQRQRIVLEFIVFAYCICNVFICIHYTAYKCISDIGNFTWSISDIMDITVWW